MTRIYPPETSEHPAGLSVRVHFPHRADGVDLPLPLLDDELEVWSQPPASAMFPHHGAGALVLYEHAWKQIEDSGVLPSIRDGAVVTLRRIVWVYAHTVFQAGASIRSGLDRVADAPPFRVHSSEPPSDADLWLLRLGALALWAVRKAACSWSTGGAA